MITQTPPNLAGQPSVDFKQSDFNNIVWNKGVNIYWDKAFECPCKSKETGNHGRSDCQNCGGAGWLFVNRTQTRMVVQSMSMDPKYEEWSKVNMGFAKITSDPREEEKYGRFSFMDRITVIDGHVEFSQVLHPQKIGGTGRYVSFLVYEPTAIDMIYLFSGASVALTQLSSTDYTLSGNVLTLAASFDSLEHPTISVRYTHRPQFHVLDFMRETMTSKVNNEFKQFPVFALARRSHYVLDAENYNGDRILNNDYSVSCR